MAENRYLFLMPALVRVTAGDLKEAEKKAMDIAGARPVTVVEGPDQKDHMLKIAGFHEPIAIARLDDDNQKIVDPVERPPGTSKRKFARHIRMDEYLVDDEPFELSKVATADLAEAASSGSLSGRTLMDLNIPVGGPHMADLLARQGSDRAFFNLDPDGRDNVDPE